MQRPENAHKKIVYFFSIIFCLKINFSEICISTNKQNRTF